MESRPSLGCASRGLAVFVGLGVVLASATSFAQQRRVAPMVERLEVVRTDDGVARPRLMSQLQVVRSALTACRGSTRTEPIRIVLLLGNGDADVIDTVRHGGDRDEALERCVREALVEWRPGADVGSGSAELELRREPVTAGGGRGGVLAMIGSAGGQTSVLGSLRGAIGVGALGLRSPTFADTGIGMRTIAVRTRWTSISATGPVRTRVVRRVLDASRSTIDACAIGAYQRGTTERRELRVGLRLSNGIVERATVTQSATQAPRTDGCVLSTLRRLRFPGEDAGATEVTATLELAPVEPPRAGTRRRAPTRP